MIKVKILNIKVVKNDIKNITYPLVIINNNIILNGKIELNFENKEILVKIEEVLKMRKGKEKLQLSYPEGYYLNLVEKLELIKTLFRKFITNYIQLFIKFRSELEACKF